MCGIAAILKLSDERALPEELFQILLALIHRGPDSAAYCEADSGRLLLGHLRLAVRDLATGGQPLFNEDGTIAVSANAELYDYDAHRSALENQGHRFRTRSDNELIVHLYEEYGLKCFDHLQGEFAFVLWDGRHKRLLAARDGLGIRPLYYHHTAKEILLSSEAKGILALDRVSRQISPDYLTGPLLGAFGHGESFFAGIQSVKPGHCLLIESARVTEYQYWQPDFSHNQALSRQEAAQQVKINLIRAVERRLASDTPVGAYLSGGLDSSIVCAVLASKAPRSEVFTISFPGKRFDESSQARQVAHALGLSLNQLDCTPEDLSRHYLQTLYHCEFPLIGLNSVAKWILSRTVRERGIRVCLTGEGADEIFGGYPYFRQERAWAMLTQGADRAAIARDFLKNLKQSEALSETLLWLNRPQGRRASFLRERLVAGSRHISALLQPDWIARARYKNPLEAFDALGANQCDSFNLTRMQSVNQLSEYIIPALGDRVEMANSVECRTPFMDRTLVESVYALPSDYFFAEEAEQFSSDKFLLRQAVTGMVPDFVLSHRKRPFLSDDWHDFYKTPSGREIMDEFTSTDRIREVGIFSPGFVARLKLLWKLIPASTGLGKQIDLLMGLILGAQCLHDQYVRNRVPRFTCSIDQSRFVKIGPDASFR